MGADNDYGHPADSVMATLRAAGADLARTDQDGDVLVEVDEGGSVSLRHS